MEKSPEAFRTISEVADLLDTPAHVLRFWESRFPQIRPVKRAGGRRYYRPGDVALLAGIKKLLHDDGLTIRGVQKILREQGIRHVSGLGAPLPDPEPGQTVVIDGAEAADEDTTFFLAALPSAPAPMESAQIIPLGQVFARHEPSRPAQPDTDGLAEIEEDVPEAPFVEAEEEHESGTSLPLFAKGVELAEPVSETSTDAGTDAAAQASLFTEVPEAGPQPSPVADAAPTDAPDTDSPPTDEEQAASGGAEATVAALLRRSRRARLAQHRDALARLHDRLADLRDRVSEASRRRVR